MRMATPLNECAPMDIELVISASQTNTIIAVTDARSYKGTRILSSSLAD